jgi:hypothetical protein
MKIKLFALRLASIILIGSSAAELIAADASLVERAKKEGTFMLYSSMNQPDVNHLFDGFRKKYPFITPKGYTTRSAALLERVVTEARAGKQFADVIQGNAFTLYLLAKRGHTEAYFSPEAKTYADSFRDPANGWIAVYLQAERHRLQQQARATSRSAQGLRGSIKSQMERPHGPR